MRPSGDGLGRLQGLALHRRHWVGEPGGFDPCSGTSVADALLHAWHVPDDRLRVSPVRWRMKRSARIEVT